MNTEPTQTAAPVQPFVIQPFYDQSGITIYNADCRKVLPWLGRFDLLLTDPPYGIGADTMTLGNGKRRLFRGDPGWDTKPPAWLISCAIESAKTAVVWGGNYFGLPATRCVLVWDKGTGDNNYADCEIAWTNMDRVVKKHFQSWVGANAKDARDARTHPTQKPLALMSWCLTLAGDVETVIDPWMGVGTTLVAAKLAGVRAVGIEINDEYCQKAVERLRQGVLPFAG